MPDSPKDWIWRRRRNESFGFWQDDQGERVGPIPLNKDGLPVLVPTEVAQAAALSVMDAWEAWLDQHDLSADLTELRDALATARPPR